MGMVLNYQLMASYAAGSLGGTLGRLNESLWRLSRAINADSREKTDWANEKRAMEPAKMAHLNQTLRLMADAWLAKTVTSPEISHIEMMLDKLKENALTGIDGKNSCLASHLQYQLLATVLDRLKAHRHSWP